MKNDPLEGLDTEVLPNLAFMQLVNVINGKHKGKSGHVFHVNQEGTNLRIQLSF